MSYPQRVEQNINDELLLYNNTVMVKPEKDWYQISIEAIGGGGNYLRKYLYFCITLNKVYLVKQETFTLSVQKYNLGQKTLFNKFKMICLEELKLLNRNLRNLYFKIYYWA